MDPCRAFERYRPAHRRPSGPGRCSGRSQLAEPASIRSRRSSDRELARQKESSTHPDNPCRSRSGGSPTCRYSGRPAITDFVSPSAPSASWPKMNIPAARSKATNATASLIDLIPVVRPFRRQCRGIDPPAAHCRPTKVHARSRSIGEKPKLRCRRSCSGCNLSANSHLDLTLSLMRRVRPGRRRGQPPAADYFRLRGPKGPAVPRAEGRVPLAGTAVASAVQVGSHPKKPELRPFTASDQPLISLVACGGASLTAVRAARSCLDSRSSALGEHPRWDGNLV